MATNVLGRGCACIGCRVRKQRCDGSRPACQPCMRAHRECVYNEPPRSRAQQLFDQVERLQEMLFELTSRPTSSMTGSGYASQTSSSSQSGSSNGGGPGSISGRSHSGSVSSNGEAQGYVYPGTNMIWYTPGSRPQPPAELTPQLRQNLLNTFFQHREKCFFEVHVTRFTPALSDNSDALHPSLVTAILLIGCYWSRAASLVTLEAELLEQTKYELSMSYSHADRLHDFIRASNLVAFYYICKGLYVEAEQQVCTSAHVSITCGLHQIISSIHQPPAPGQQHGQLLLPPARDNVDLGERIHTLWQIFSLDKVVSMITLRPAYLLGGGPEVNPLLAFTTPWPRLMIEYETGNLSFRERQSVQDLYSLTPTLGLRPETLVGLAAQGLSLAQRAMYMTTPNIMTSNHEAEALDAIIQDYIGRLPGLRSGGESGQIIATPGHSPVNHRVVFIRTLGYTASLLLHQNTRDQMSRNRCHVAAQNLAMIVSELTTADYGSVFIGLGHIWIIAGRVLVALTSRPSGGAAQQFLDSATSVLSALKKLNLVYPPLGYQTHHLHQLIYGTP